MRVLIIGAGGHAQVVADILFQMRQAGADIVPLGYLDDNSTLTGKHFLNLPVLGRIADLPGIPHDALIVAIGDNATRQRLFETLRDRGENWITACHPGAVIATGVRLGAGCMICAGVVVNTGSVIEDNVILNTSCTVDHHNHVGNHAHVAPGVHLGGEVTVGEGALIGIGATVIPGRSIGAWSIVGAGAVLTRDLPAHVTAVGVPARVVKESKVGRV